MSDDVVDPFPEDDAAYVMGALSAEMSGLRGAPRRCPERTSPSRSCPG